MSETVRSFIAIELPADIRVKLAEIQESLGGKRNSGVKWVSPESIHLTLKFLGNVDTDLLPQIVSEIRAASDGIMQFNLSVASLGVFPNSKRPRVVWVGIVGPPPELKSLQERIDNGLLALGFPKDAREFNPHLTLGRVKESAVLPQVLQLAELLKTASVGSVGSFIVSEVCLMKSTLTPNGAVYEQIANVEVKSYD